MLTYGIPPEFRGGVHYETAIRHRVSPKFIGSRNCVPMAFTAESKSVDQPGKVVNPARGQLNRENMFSLSSFALGNLVSQDEFGSPVPRQPAHLHTQAESGAYLRDSSRVPRWRPFIYLNRHTPSGQSRVYRVTQSRTAGVHCRESAGSGPVHLKLVPVTGAAVAGHHGPINIRLSFPHPLLV